MRRKELETCVVRRHDQRHDARLHAELLAELDRALVPMVAVGDEELRVPQAVGCIGRHPPQACPVDREIWQASRGCPSSSWASARRRIGSGWTRVSRSSRRRSSRIRACVRSCGSTFPSEYGFAARETITPWRPRVTPSGPTNSSSASHTAGSRSCSRAPALQPLAVQLAGRSRGFGQRDVDDVVGAPRVQLRALLVRYGVVRRSDEVGQRPGGARVPDGAKRLGVGHRRRAYQWVRAI